MSAASRSTRPRGSAARTRGASASVISVPIHGSPRSEKVGGDVDGERENERVEEERHHALDHDNAAHPRQSNVDVRGREGAADDEGLIDKFAPPRLRRARKFEAAANVARMRLVVGACIVEREYGLDESPRA